MRRVLFQIAGIQIYSYPAMLYLGLVVGIALENLLAHWMRLDALRVFIATLLLVVPTLAGARLLHVALYWKTYRRARARIWRRSEGGFCLYGGLPLSLLVSVPLLSLLQLPFGAFWDVATVTILAGMIFTRVGCLLNGCCAGHPTESRFSIYAPDVAGVFARRIPTQLLEALLGALLLAGAMVLWGRLPFGGALFLYALTGYGIGRWFLESTREQQDRIGGVRVHRMISGLLCISALLLLSILRHKSIGL